MFALLAAIFIDALGLGVIYPILTPLLLDPTQSVLPAGTSEASRNMLFGVVLALYPFAMFVGAPIFGALSDKFGRRKTIAWCLFGTAAGFGVSVLGIQFASVALLAVGRAITGLAAGTFATAQAGIIDASAPDQKTANIGRATFANAIGFAVGPEIGNFLSDRAHGFNLSTPFVATLLFAVANAILVLTTYREKFTPDPSRRVDPLSGFKNVTEAMGAATTRRLCLILAFFMVCWSMYFGGLPDLLTEQYHQTPRTVGNAMFAGALVFGFSLMVLMKQLLKVIPLARLMLLSLATLAVSSLLTAIVPLVAVVWLTLVTAPLSAAMVFAAITTFFSNAYSAEDQGKGMGVVGATYAFAWGVAMLAQGWLSGISLQVSGVVAAVCGFLALGLTLTLAKAPATSVSPEPVG